MKWKKLWKKAFSLSGYNFQGKFWLLIFKTGPASVLFQVWYWSTGSERQRQTFTRIFGLKVFFMNMCLLNYWIMLCWRIYEVNASILWAFAKAFFFFFIVTSRTKKIDQTIFLLCHIVKWNSVFLHSSNFSHIFSKLFKEKNWTWYKPP